mgnify:CR=1 FL=1
MNTLLVRPSVVVASAAMTVTLRTPLADLPVLGLMM